jgi:predicted phage terminase large subunit-like protein
MQYDKKVLNALLRQDFSSFIGKVFYTINPGSSYHSNWHIDLIAEYLEEVRRGKIKRLIINIPPRALKSVCVSVAWPAWLLGQNSTTRIMAASYSSTLSIKHSLDCRLVMSSNWYKNLFPKTILSRKHNQKSKFLTDQNGFRFATSIGGSATGEGGDILIIDDPHNPTQINSPKIRAKAIDWFEQTFVSRLNDKANGAIVLVMQRLHEDDMAGHLIASGGWELLKISALSQEDTEYHLSKKRYFYAKGTLLNSKRDQMKFLQNLEVEIGSRNFAAQYLQDPLPANYNLLSLEDISYYEILPTSFQYFVISWDTAIKISENADYSVGSCWGIVDDHFYLISVIREKMTYTMLKNKVQKLSSKYKPKYLLIEDKSSGQSIIQDLKLMGYNNIKAIKPMVDKITRFASVVPLFQSGRVLLPKKASFNSILIKELTSFPNSKHDDIVDSVSQFLNFAKEMTFPVKARIRKL